MRDEHSDLPLYPTGPTVSFDPFGDGEIEAAIPTIAAQREIWTSLGFGPDAHGAYNDTVSIWFDEPLDLDRLTDALHALVARHPLLRAGFSADGRWLSVYEHGAPDIAIVDLRPMATDACDRALEEIAARHVTEPFDLGRPAGLRATIARLPERRTRLTLTVSHILCDGLSWGVLLTDLGALLEGPADDTEPDQALDFMEHALAEETPDALAPHLDYWQEVLADGGPDWSLPLDTDPPPGRHFASTRVDMLIPLDVVTRVKALGKAHGMTFHTMILSATAALFHRLSGSDDLLIGIPVAGQATSGHRTMIGHAVHILPIRSRISRDMPLLAFAQGIAATVLDARAHECVDFGPLLQTVPVRRQPGRVPLIPVIVNIDGAMGPGTMAGQTVRLVDEPRRFENFEIFLDLLDAPDGLLMRWNASTVLFRRETIVRFGGALETLLTGMVDAPGGTVSALPLTSAKDLARLREIAFGPPVPAIAPGRDTVPAAVWAAAEAWPDSAAVSDDSGNRLTYRELLNRAERIAAALTMAGVGPGDRVGIHLDRTVDLIGALLGVLRSGGCLLFLDAEQPPGRRREVLEDAAPKVVLVQTDDDLNGLLPPGTRALPLAETLLTEGPLPPMPTPDTLSDHYYTSGSTGRPKGIPLTHRGLMIFMTGAAQVMGADATLVWMTQAAVVFDIALLDCLVPLMHGGRVVVPSAQTRKDPLALADLADREGVTHWQATPTSWGMLIGLGWAGNPRLTVVSGGEALPRDLANALLDRVAAVWNFYGPTEASVYATAGRIGRDEPITVGKPLPGYEIRIVDRDGALVPPGAVGEILIAGPPVAEGYHNRPEQTEAAFFTDDDGLRVYRTGDLGQWDADGRLIHRGRIDAQIKLRGHRIELEEIEARLLRLDGIAQAGVVLADANTPQARLVAFLVTAPDHTPTTMATLRESLLADLPDAMIPTACHWVDTLPQTSTGKLDRKALLAGLLNGTPTEPPVSSAATGSTPTAAEPVPCPHPTALPAHLARMVELWQEVLPERDIDPDAAFFSLGGSSLDAAALAVEIGKAYGTQPSLGDIFANDTPRALATLMATRIRPVGIERATCLSPGRPDLPPIILFPPQGGQILRYRELATTPELEPPLWAFEQTTDLLDRRTVGDIVEAFLPDIALISGDHTPLLGGFSFGGVLAFEAAQRMIRQGRSVAGLVLLDAQLALPESLWFKLRRAWLEGRFAANRWRWLREKMHRNTLKMVGRYVPPDWYEADLEDLPGYKALMDIHTKALMAYRPKPTSLPITLIASDGDQVARRLDPNNGWQPFAKGQFERIGLPFQAHIELLEHVHLPAVTETLNAVAWAATARKTTAGRTNPPTA